MSDIKRYVPLKQIVAMALDETDKSQGDFDKCWIFAFRALVDIKYTVENETQTFRIPVDPNLTVPFPPSLLSWRKIGVLNGNNEIATLKINKQLTKFKDTSPDRLSAMTPDVGIPSLAYNYYINYWGNGFPMHYYGMGGGLIQPGECVVDEKNRVIVLGPGFAYSHVMIEGTISPEQNDDYMIDIFCQEAVIAFIKWKLRVGSENEYYNAVDRAYTKMHPQRLQEINQALREGQSFKLKS